MLLLLLLCLLLLLLLLRLLLLLLLWLLLLLLLLLWLPKINHVGYGQYLPTGTAPDVLLPVRTDELDGHLHLVGGDRRDVHPEQREEERTFFKRERHCSMEFLLLPTTK